MTFSAADDVGFDASGKSAEDLALRVRGELSSVRHASGDDGCEASVAEASVTEGYVIEAYV